MNEILGIIIAAIVCWLNFVIIDTFMGLPEQPGVIGAKILVKMLKIEMVTLQEVISKETFFVLQMHLQVH